METVVAFHCHVHSFDLWLLSRLCMSGQGGTVAGVRLSAGNWGRVEGVG